MIDFKTETLNYAVEYLKNRKIENAKREALWLFEYVFGKDRELVVAPDDDKEIKNSVARIASLKNSKRFYELLTKRANGEPLQYLLGEWEFYGYPMKVGEGVLIPRPETEFLIDLGKEFLTAGARNAKSPTSKAAGFNKAASPNHLLLSNNLKNKDKAMVIDLCAGTGCVGIVMCRETNCNAVGVELSKEAARFATENSELNQVQDRYKVFEGDIFDESLIEKLPLADCIFANPPYLSEKDMKELQREVSFEPQKALYGGRDGLDFYRKIFVAWKSKLKENGLFAVEVGDGQADSVRQFMQEAGFETDVMKDYALIDRIVFNRRSAESKALVLND